MVLLWALVFAFLISGFEIVGKVEEDENLCI